MNSATADGLSSPSATTPRSWLATIAFGTTLIIWLMAYLLSMPGVEISAWVIVTAAAGVMFAGGWAAGRSATGSIMDGVLLGAAITAINLLILGSFGSGEHGGEVITSALPWIGGFLIAAVILCTAGMVVGRATAGKSTHLHDWTGRLALVVACITLVLITAGGVVTGLEAGMAVPDWLTTFNYPMVLYPLELMQQDPGKYFEHFHRLWGLLVGLSTIVLTVQLYRFDTRTWVKRTGVAVLLLVIIQGVMGGTRVTEDSLLLAIIHGVFGQILFAILVCLTAFTSPHWMSDAPAKYVTKAKSDYALSTSLFIIILVQITLGAVYRHLTSSEEFSDTAAMILVNAHMGLGILVAVKLLFVGFRTWVSRKDQQPLSRLAMVMIILTPLQIVLGLIAYVMVAMADRGPNDPIPALEVIFTSAHQVTGAVILATSALLLVWTRRLLLKNES